MRKKPIQMKQNACIILYFSIWQFKTHCNRGKLSSKFQLLNITYDLEYIVICHVIFIVGGSQSKIDTKNHFKCRLYHDEYYYFRCFERCDNDACMEKVERLCSVCEELQMVPCSKPFQCPTPCEEILECGHKCQGSCYIWSVILFL